jgi:hypothetical protein
LPRATREALPALSAHSLPARPLPLPAPLSLSLPPSPYTLLLYLPFKIANLKKRKSEEMNEADSMLIPPQPPKQCPICLDEPEEAVHLCQDCNDPICKGCMISYVRSTVMDAFLGSCPVIACPSAQHQQNKKRKLLNYKTWKVIVPNDASSKYVALAGSLLAFLCGGCHSLKTLDVGHDLTACSISINHLTSLLETKATSPDHKFPALEQLLEKYYQGDILLEETYDEIHKHFFPNLRTASDLEAWDTFQHILRTIPDPERRANLHLRFLRDHPRMRTLCCNREHCFRCKTKDFHEGKTCLENLNTLDHSIVPCPSCGIALAKGDGCNSVTCVCGKQFSWSAEKENTERCQQFLSTYPTEPTSQCASLLCSHCSSQELLLARAWQTRHRSDVSRALKDWFKRTYWPCPSQCSTILLFETLPEGVREASDLWRHDYSKEVEKCRNENRIALTSIFSTLVPDPADRPAFAQRYLQQSRRHGSSTTTDARLVQSVQAWIEKNSKEYAVGIENMEIRSAEQFLHLYGQRPVKTIKPAYINSPCAYEWNRSASNSELTYTNDNTTVERVGSVSCYPAAFATLVAERALFRVVIDAAPKTSNWITFGVARKNMPNSSSDGVGRTRDTWGLSDDRSSSTNRTIISASGSEVSQFRKLAAGDILSATIDTVEGWCEININENEFTYRFENLPVGTKDDYWFAMTFANDHRVSILYNAPPSPIGPLAAKTNHGGQLNPDHTIMYANFKKQLKKILVDPDDLAIHPSSSAYQDDQCKLLTEPDEWLALCGWDDKVAYERFQVIKEGIEQALAMRRITVDENSLDDATTAIGQVRAMTFKQLLAAASWYRKNRDHLREQEKADKALNFSLIHGDDAPFIAAISLVEYYQNKVGKEEQAAAFAYMQMFSEEMQSWYEYDAGSREPVIENVARGCVCLPRHIRTCPKCK